eukprot:SAG22_NODE_75_length_22256_cov_45.062960_15_plen_173_part_00
MHRTVDKPMHAAMQQHVCLQPTVLVGRQLRDMWNLRALTHTDGSLEPAETKKKLELGAPREQGHYGFMLTDLYLYPLISGQNVDMPAGRLSFVPRYPAPYVLPVLLAGVEGSIRSEKKGTYTLELAFGALKLPSGGLSVDGVVCTKAVDLIGGKSITWSAAGEENEDEKQQL